MKTKIPFTLCCLILQPLWVLPARAHATVFTYQGPVTTSGTNFNGPESL